MLLDRSQGLRLYCIGTCIHSNQTEVVSRGEGCKHLIRNQKHVSCTELAVFVRGQPTTKYYLLIITLLRRKSQILAWWFIEFTFGPITKFKNLSDVHSMRYCLIKSIQ